MHRRRASEFPVAPSERSCESRRRVSVESHAEDDRPRVAVLVGGKRPMTREELARALAAIERLLDDRVEVWRDILDADGRVIRSIYRGSFQRTPGSHIG